MTDPRIIEQRRIQPLADALTDLPPTFPEMSFQLMAVSEEFRRRCAKALEPAVNQFIRACQPKSLDEHRQLARKIDDYVNLLGVCVAVDGKPGVPYGVTADPSSGKKAGFAVLLDGERGKRPVKVKLDLENPRFSLIAAPPNIENRLRPLREDVYLMRR